MSFLWKVLVIEIPHTEGQCRFFITYQSAPSNTKWRFHRFQSPRRRRGACDELCRHAPKSLPAQGLSSEIHEVRPINYVFRYQNPGRTCVRGGVDELQSHAVLAESPGGHEPQLYGNIYGPVIYRWSMRERETNPWDSVAWGAILDIVHHVEGTFSSWQRGVLGGWYTQ